jgi:hypothetical protein
MTSEEPTGQLAESRRRLGLPSQVEDDAALDQIAALLIGKSEIGAKDDAA